MNWCSTKQIKIRKERKCLGCNRKFPIGSTMLYITFVEGGKHDHWYLCSTCHELYSKYFDEFADIDGVSEYFVCEALDKGQTPEELLNTLNTRK